MVVSTPGILHAASFHKATIGVSNCEACQLEVLWELGYSGSGLLHPLRMVPGLLQAM